MVLRQNLFNIKHHINVRALGGWLSGWRIGWGRQAGGLEDKIYNLCHIATSIKFIASAWARRRYVMRKIFEKGFALGPIAILYKNANVKLFEVKTEAVQKLDVLNICTYSIFAYRTQFKINIEYMPTWKVYDLYLSLANTNFYFHNIIYILPALHFACCGNPN